MVRRLPVSDSRFSRFAEQEARRALYPTSRREVQAAPISPPLNDERPSAVQAQGALAERMFDDAHRT